MGIKGLLQFLKEEKQITNLKKYKGCTAAVDAYCWLHKAVYGCVEQIAIGNDQGQYIKYCEKYWNTLISCGIKPILVFDGQNLPAKAATEKDRREKRKANRERANALLAEGKKEQARQFFERCIDITPEMAHKVILAAVSQGIDCIVAPYEADAQLAYLNLTGIAQLIISEDSDLLCFGCDRVFFKLDLNGNGVEMEQSKILKNKSFKNRFTFDHFLKMCILSGCDYLPSLPNIGLVKASKFMVQTKSVTGEIEQMLKRLPLSIKMPMGTLTQEYIEDFKKAYLTFKYQIVFDPITKKRLPLTPYDVNCDVEPQDMLYAGKYCPPAQALQIALGNINLRTGAELLPTIDPDNTLLRTHGPLSVWHPDFKPKGKFTKPNALTIDRHTTTKDKQILVQTSKIVKRTTIESSELGSQSEDVTISLKDIAAYTNPKKDIAAYTNPKKDSEDGPCHSDILVTPKTPAPSATVENEEAELDNDAICVEDVDEMRSSDPSMASTQKISRGDDQPSSQHGQVEYNKHKTELKCETDSPPKEKRSRFFAQNSEASVEKPKSRLLMAMEQYKCAQTANPVNHSPSFAWSRHSSNTSLATPPQPFKSPMLQSNLGTFVRQQSSTLTLSGSDKSQVNPFSKCRKMEPSVTKTPVFGKVLSPPAKERDIYDDLDPVVPSASGRKRSKKKAQKKLSQFKSSLNNSFHDLDDSMTSQDESAPKFKKVKGEILVSSDSETEEKSVFAKTLPLPGKDETDKVIRKTLGKNKLTGTSKQKKITQFKSSKKLNLNSAETNNKSTLGDEEEEDANYAAELSSHYNLCETLGHKEIHSREVSKVNNSVDSDSDSNIFGEKLESAGNTFNLSVQNKAVKRHSYEMTLKVVTPPEEDERRCDSDSEVDVARLIEEFTGDELPSKLSAKKPREDNVVFVNPFKKAKNGPTGQFSVPAKKLSNPFIDTTPENSRSKKLKALGSRISQTFSWEKSKEKSLSQKDLDKCNSDSGFCTPSDGLIENAKDESSVDLIEQESDDDATVKILNIPPKCQQSQNDAANKAVVNSTHKLGKKTPSSKTPKSRNSNKKSPKVASEAKENKLAAIQAMFARTKCAEQMKAKREPLKTSPSSNEEVVDLT